MLVGFITLREVYVLVEIIGNQGSFEWINRYGFSLWPVFVLHHDPDQESVVVMKNFQNLIMILKKAFANLYNLKLLFLCV